MLVGSTNIDCAYIDRVHYDFKRVEAYVLGLVPNSLRHYMPIVENQFYYTALMYRRNSKLDWSLRRQVLTELFRRGALNGEIGEVYEIRDCLICANNEVLLNMLGG